MFAAIAAAVDPDALLGSRGEFLDHGGRNRLLPHTLGHRLGAVGVCLGLIADGLQAGDALLQRGVVQIGNSVFDCIEEALEAQICVGGALVQFDEMLAPAFGTLLATVQHRRQHVFEPLGL